MRTPTVTAAVVVGALLASAGAPAPTCAQPAARETTVPPAAASDVTTLQETAITAWVSYRAVRARWGDEHEDTRAHAAETRAAGAALEVALAAGGRVEAARITARLEAELADVTTRLAEIGARCGGPSAEVGAAQARRDALAEAIARLTSDGSFVPR